MTRIALAALCSILLTGCSVRYVAPSPPPPSLPPLPSVAPSGFAFPGEAAGNVDCSTAVGAQTGYTLFGAKAEDFNAAHQGDGLLIRCSNDGKVIVLQLDVSPPASAGAVLSRAQQQLPGDLKPVYDKTQPDCRSLQYESATLARQLGQDDPQGIVNIELESALAGDFKYDAGRVDTAVIHQLYGLNQSSACIR